ncbi:MAG: thioredoxin domain-containing protein [Rhabdochlamydiaceae bacterium]|nr:thioredoxin domain-containing protein [Candidatus Amphrikana amoebophyrae]
MKKFLILFVMYSPLFGFEYLDTNYLFKFGSSDSKTKIIEYIAFNCPNCIKDLSSSHQLQKLTSHYIESGELEWIIHPDPSDLFTVQVLAAFESVPVSDKNKVFWKLINELATNFRREPINILEETVCKHYPTLGDIKSIDYLKTTKVFEAARQYLSQKGIPRSVPTIEINGNVYKEYPTTRLIKRELKQAVISNKSEGGK